MVQRNTPVGRVRHGKRLPKASDNESNIIPGPVTSSSPVITPTVTVFVSPASITSSTSSLVISSSSSPAPIPYSIPSSSPGTEATTPSVSVNNSGGKSSAAAPSSAASSQGIPTGSIIGIVLAIVLLLAAAAVFWFRRRAIANRLKMRGWAGRQKNAPSFLWIGPKEANGITPYPVMSFAAARQVETSARATSGGGPIQPLPYAPTDNGLPFIPPPAPPPPPRAAGLYDYAASSPTSVPSALTPAGGSPGAPAPASGRPLESAKVRFTFIPTLPDELSISTGEVIRIHDEYDDGWVLCSNARNEMGMVPLECLDRGSLASEAVREYKKLGRVSSLAANPYGGYQ